MWSGRRPRTRLAEIFTEYCHAESFDALIEMLASGQGRIGPEAAPLVFRAAEEGDPAALELIEWAGSELGELAAAVIRQLNFEDMDFDVVLCGSMFDGGRRLIDPMQKVVLKSAPAAKFIRLKTPPVAGAVLLGMEAAGLTATPEIRSMLELSLRESTHKATESN
jgi:N-acetylglucosamine kinase-like BadF-type ATPase